MNQFKQTKAVAECKAIRRADACPRKCMHWVSGSMLFCKDAFAAERRGK